MRKIFFKLLNNSKFGIDSRNNIDNCILEPIYDDLGEISYIKKFTTILNDDTYRDFFSAEHMKEEIIQTFQGKIFALDKNDPPYEARKEYFENKIDQELHAVESFVKSKNKRKRKFQNVDGKISESLDPRKIKMVIEFSDHEAASIKSIAVKKLCKIKVTTRFMSGKLLMFAKLSLKSFIHDIIETFCFPDQNVRGIFKKYGIKKVEIFHVLTDTDSTSLKFMFISEPNSEIPESKYKNIIFKIITSSQIYKRFENSHEFWDIIRARKEQKRKNSRTMKFNILIIPAS